MKLLIIIFALFATGPESHPSPAPGLTVSGRTFEINISVSELKGVRVTDCPELIPSIPLIASYEDQKEISALINQENLLPEIPMNADFADKPAVSSAKDTRFSPAVPLEADFQATL